MRPVILALCLTLFTATRLAATPPPARQPADTLVGTLRAIDAAHGTLRVITGVGLALRIVELRLTADTKATAAGAPLELVALRPGDVVRVIGGVLAEGRVAYTIERLAPAPGGAP